MTDPLFAIRSALPRAGIEPVDIVCTPGDSITVGSVAGKRELAWPQRLRDKLRAHCFSGSVRGGLGYAPAFSSSLNVGNFWTRVGAVEESTLRTGLGMRCLKVPNGASITLAFTGTGIDILHTTGTNSAWAYELDGVASSPLDWRESGVNAGRVFGIHGLCDGNHTIRIKGTPDGAAYIEGAMIYRGDEDHGVRVWEGGRSGAMCSTFNETTRWFGSLNAIPHKRLIIHMLGINEYSTGVSAKVFGRELVTSVGTLAALTDPDDASILFVAQHRRMPIAGYEDWSDFTEQIETCARNYGYGFLDLAPFFGEPDHAIAAGLIQVGTGLHPTAKGHATIADLIANHIIG